MKWMLWACFYLLLVALIVATVASSYLQHPKFGVYPSGERLARIERSPHYTDGEFQNTIPTAIVVGNVGIWSFITDGLRAPDDLRPDHAVPTVKTDLKSLPTDTDTVVWLGHSSFFLVFSGKRILIDPVLSPAAAPLPFLNRSFKGTNLYSAADIPPIDLLLITHDHWDHLDYDTLTALRGRIGKAVVPLGVGADLEHWGFATSQISELDWWDGEEFPQDVRVHLVPARHYSGRLLTRNKTLWGGFVLESAHHRLLFSGDSGYGPHFKDIQRRFGGFDLVALDMGQYDQRWPFVHMTPEEAAEAADDLATKALMPAHVGRFSIARHSWTDPFDRIMAASGQHPKYRLLTPEIGEPLVVDALPKSEQPWWSSGTLSHD